MAILKFSSILYMFILPRKCSIAAQPITPESSQKQVMPTFTQIGSLMKTSALVSETVLFGKS